MGERKFGRSQRVVRSLWAAFPHQEKAELLPAGLQVSAYVQVDDTGARHRGQTGFCTHIGNDLFASFESSDTKSRLSFLEGLRRPHTDYVVKCGGRAGVRKGRRGGTPSRRALPQECPCADPPC